MNFKKNLFLVSLMFVAFSLLLVINPVGAEDKKDNAVKANEALASVQQVNINQADVKTLTTLKGIGKDRALKIIEFREKNGPFQKAEDLMKVKGIGKKIFEQNKDFITI
jgi:competence protein ComEA